MFKVLLGSSGLPCATQACCIYLFNPGALLDTYTEILPTAVLLIYNYNPVKLHSHK